MEELEVIEEKRELRAANFSSVHLFLKRVFDIVFSFIGIIVCFPVIVITCILVTLESRGNPIYSQKRVGLNNKEFNMYKVRSMVIDAEKNGAQWAKSNDSRVTKVGKFIRLTRIDEMPQLFNILKGEMSMVGPRPERYIFYEIFEKEIPEFRERLLVKPGLTGYAQVNGGYELSPEQKLELDLYYIDNASFKMEMKIIFKTINVVVTGEGAR